MALSQIHQGVDYSIFGKIANAKIAKEAWNILKLSYKGVEKAQKSKLQSLRREYERYEMSNSESVEQYFSRVTDLVNKMRVYGEDIPESKVVEKILRTMPMKFDHVVTTIIESHDTDIMTVAELQGSIESHVSRILEKTEKGNEEALKRGREGGNINFRGRGRGSFRGRGRCNFNQQWRDNNFRPSNQGRGGHNVRSTNQDDRIFISQKKFASDILKKFMMVNSKPVSTPVEGKLKLTSDIGGKKVNPTLYKSLIGSLRYLTATRPDIVYGVGLLSRFMEKPRDSHWQAAKRILRYIKGTLTEGIFYDKDIDVNLVGYIDSDWAGDIETRKSTSGYAFNLGSGTISWSLKKQQVVALSTAEAEYIAAASCATQAV
uniref:Retrovirus-related Pol polyprotein from transposon TNT 1-94 n=1 Tax=Cajanus cajan TaxID=3821 RepID=A0A151S6U1_CAJCA|nr:Retrovirus-related Pol polyprotein from transposon TNT 1-94 [Cajanus cajan]